MFRTHDIEDPEVRSLILWTIYSIVYEIDQNLRYLYREVTTSLNTADDPEAVSCALGIVHRSVGSHQVLTRNPNIPKTLVGILISLILHNLLT